MENAAIAGAKHPPNVAIEGYVLNSGILPLYRIEAVPSDFDAAKSDVPLFSAPLYRATYCIACEFHAFLPMEAAARSFCGCGSIRSEGGGAFIWLVRWPKVASTT